MKKLLIMFGFLPMLTQIQSEHPSSSSASSSKKSGRKNHSTSSPTVSHSQLTSRRDQRCNRSPRSTHQSTRTKTSDSKTYHELNIDFHCPSAIADQLGCSDLIVRVFPGKGHSFPLRCRCTSSSCLSCVPETDKTTAVHQLTIQKIQKNQKIEGYATFTCNHTGRRCAFCKRNGFDSDSVRVQIQIPARDSDESSDDSSDSDDDYWSSPDLQPHSVRLKEQREAKSCPHGRRRCRQCTKETRLKGSVKRSRDMKSATLEKITQTLDPTADDGDDFPDDRQWTEQDHFMATQGDDLIIHQDIPWGDKLCSETIPQDIDLSGSDGTLDETEWIVRS